MLLIWLYFISSGISSLLVFTMPISVQSRDCTTWEALKTLKITSFLYNRGGPTLLESGSFPFPDTSIVGPPSTIQKVLSVSKHFLLYWDYGLRESLFNKNRKKTKPLSFMAYGHSDFLFKACKECPNAVLQHIQKSRRSDLHNSHTTQYYTTP